MRNCLLIPLAIGLLLDCSAFADGVPPVVPAPRPAAGEAELRFWLENMVVHHNYTLAEAAAVTGLSPEEIEKAVQRFRLPALPIVTDPSKPLKILPYPGGRHPRLGFFDGAIDPQRDTKVSIFTPWDPRSYVVVDVPEAIWSNLGLTYLAHTHIDTIWTKQGIKMEPLEWSRRVDGALSSERRLPNGIVFGVEVAPHVGHAAFRWWLRNGTPVPLTGLRAQVCAMLGHATGFAAQSETNKVLDPPFVAARDTTGRRWVITAWDALDRAWQNPPVPCLHSDPALTDCPPGETRSARGWLWFYEGYDVKPELARLRRDFLVPAKAKESPKGSATSAWPRLQVTHSWIANSHADARFMPQGIEGMYVSPDGTTFTNIFWEEGGGNVAVIGTDGEVHPRPHMPGYFGWGHNGGRAVAANSKYVFFSQIYNNEGGGLREPSNWPPTGKTWYGVSRRSREDIGTGRPFAGGKGGKDSPAGCFLPVHKIVSSIKESEAHIRGLAASETEVYVACAIDNSIKVYDAEEMTLKKSWVVKNAWHIALDGEGALWVSIGEDATEIHRYDPHGKRLPQTITLPPGSRSGSFCIDPNGRMLIGDVGENEWVLIYSDITTAPKPAGNFGTRKGIFSGTPGILGPLKFSQVRGIGLDAEGSIYIANTQYRTNGPGIWLEKYSPGGQLRWRRHCVVFTDSSAVDPESDGKSIYGMTERYDVDLTKSDGKEATLAAFTANYYKYPHDPRFVQYDNSGVYVRTLGGKKFIITTGMGSGQSPFCIYRLAPETDGEVMIPCVVWSKSTKYPHAPEGNWLWRDTNGNGQFDAGEYAKTDVHDAYGGNSAFIDARGDLWMTCWGPLRRITYEGLDPHGIPIYSPGFETIEAPKPYGGIRRVRYDTENDVMYLAGTSGDKTNHWKSMGVHLCRYDNWSKGNRAAAWHVVCTHQPDSNCEPISFDVAGDYVFVAIAERGKVGEREISRGHLSIYHSRTGAIVGYIEPPKDWGVGWMDAVECLSVHCRKNGEYLILQEEDGRSKNLLHRWTPDASAKVR